MTHAEPKAISTEWQLAICYDDAPARARALHLATHLHQHFEQDLVLSFTWWRFRYLEDPEIALVARHYAIAADIIVFSTSTPDLFPLPVLNWIESWIPARRRLHGLLVPLLGSRHIPAQIYSTNYFYLRHVADRASMDFLAPRAVEADWEMLHLEGRSEDVSDTTPSAGRN